MWKPLPDIEVYEIGKKYVHIKVGLCCAYWIAIRDGKFGNDKTYHGRPDYCPECGEQLHDKKLKETYD